MYTLHEPIKQINFLRLGPSIKETIIVFSNNTCRIHCSHVLNQLDGNCCCVTRDRIIVYFEETCLVGDRPEAVELLRKQQKDCRPKKEPNLKKKKNSKHKECLFIKFKKLWTVLE